MRRSHQWLAAASVAGVVLAAFAWGAVEHAREEARWGTLQTYCLECHNSVERTGELSFEDFSAESVPQHAEVFERVVMKLRGRLMPPPGAPEPGQEEVDALIAWLERSICLRTLLDPTARPQVS